MKIIVGLFNMMFGQKMQIESISQQFFRVFVSMTLVLLGLSLPPIAKADSVHVAVAANMQFAFEELKDEFKKQLGHVLIGVFHSSGECVNQI